MEMYKPNGIYLGDARTLEDHIEHNSVSLSVWSPVSCWEGLRTRFVIF